MNEKIDPERLLHAVEGLSGEIHILWQSLDEFRTDLIHELRNRYQETIGMPQKSSETLEQSVTCFQCDNTADSLAEAVQMGWNDLQEDPKGLSWNYLGTCPSCRVEEAAIEAPKPVTTAKAKPRELF